MGDTHALQMWKGTEKSIWCNYNNTSQSIIPFIYERNQHRLIPTPRPNVLKKNKYGKGRAAGKQFRRKEEGRKRTASLNCKGKRGRKKSQAQSC